MGHVFPFHVSTCYPSTLENFPIKLTPTFETELHDADPVGGQDLHLSCKLDYGRYVTNNLYRDIGRCS